jgi:hypothetical protein
MEGAVEDREEYCSVEDYGDSTANSTVIHLRVDTNRIPSIKPVSKAKKLAEKNKAHTIEVQEGIQSVLSKLNGGSIVSNSLGPEDNSPPAKQEVLNEPISECFRKYYQYNYMEAKGNWTGGARNMRRFKKVVGYMREAAESANYKDMPFLSEIKPNLYCRDEKGVWIVNPLYESWEDKLKTVAFEIQNITKAQLAQKENQKTISNVHSKAKAGTSNLVNTLYAVDFWITALDST